MPKPQTPHFDNSYARLPAQFHHRQQAQSVPAPGFIRVNDALATELGIDPDWLNSEEGLAMLSGNAVPAGADPIATAYAGYQFGSWNPQLGDGRALLIGEVLSPKGQRFDVQLKGSGRTPYSRGGDGKSPLGPVLREYLISEAMAALHIATSRSLAAVTTGETVYRDSALPGAILTRVAGSHIRVGTVQFFAAKQDREALSLLCQHVIERHFPDAATAENPVLAMLEAIIQKQAELIAQWQLVGFIHGVMNTDNMLLCGETIDYGPCAFMDRYDAATVFSSIDRGGRYAYGNQPSIAHWNLAGLAQAVLPLLDEDEDKAVQLAQTAVNAFPDRFLSAYQAGMAAKLGLAEYRDGDDALVKDLLELMAKEQLDFTQSFLRLTELANAKADARHLPIPELPASFDEWLQCWQQRQQHDTLDFSERTAMMRAANPVFIPRNHRVEEAIHAAVTHNDFSLFNQLLDVLAQPFEYRPEFEDYLYSTENPQGYQTFCGT
jgi:uncharacterized protein YdiU (UPF0061 family)